MTILPSAPASDLSSHAWIGMEIAVTALEVRDLGLSSSSPRVEDVTHELCESQAPRMLTRLSPNDTVDDAEKANEQPRCIKCYSADVTCHDVEKPLSYAGANLFDPITVHARSCTCNSCGHEWDDEDTA